MCRDAYIAAHEELVTEEMERTGCSWEDAYDRTGDAAWVRMRDNLADRADMLRQERKDRDV